MNIYTIKEGVNSFLDTVADGWRHLCESATNALTQFKPSAESKLPSQDNIDDPFFGSSYGWSMLSGEVFEDEKRLVVRLEVPGMDKKDMIIEVNGDMLILSGEKRFERENSDGRWRTMQCAYGSFRRVVPLTAPVLVDKAKATYTNGVLRVELPKNSPGKVNSRRISVD